MKSTMNIHWKDWYWRWSSNKLTIWCKELIRKDPDAGKDWRQEKGMTEEEMVDGITSCVFITAKKSRCEPPDNILWPFSISLSFYTLRKKPLFECYLRRPFKQPLMQNFTTKVISENFCSVTVGDNTSSILLALSPLLCRQFHSYTVLLHIFMYYFHP